MRGVFSTCGAIACTWFCLSACDAPAAAAPSSAAAVQQTYSNYLPPLESIALPGEQPILDTFVAQTPRGTTPAAVLAAADEALAKLGSPTKLRGLVQFARARALAALNRDLDAVEAAEESARLLPGYSAPLIVGFTANAYLNRTGQATEYLMRAIDTDPTTARTIDDYEIDNLMRRLDGFDDRAREEAISDRLLGIGWIGDHLDSRSNLAVRAIRRRLDNGDIGGAKALVPKLLDPGDSRALLIVNAYAPIWPDIEAWGGAKLERQWPIYLQEAESRWKAGRTSIAARDYLSALDSAGRYDAAVRSLLPLLDNPRPDDVELIFMVAPLANALAKLGRWRDAEALFEHAQQVWPLGSQANALNISANYSVLLLREGRPGDGLARIDASLEDARKWGPQVGAPALAAMHHNRACLLHELGRDSEAAVSAAQALAVQHGSAAAMLHLCLGDAAAAKTALLDALENDAIRDDVLRFVQPPDEDPYPSEYGRKQRAASDALRSDPELLRAVGIYGRVLPWPANQAARADPPSTEVVQPQLRSAAPDRSSSSLTTRSMSPRW